jgi:hypothetical protein
VINGHKVVVFTPWGRELTASILFEYLKRDHAAGVVDEWHLWLNTDDDQVRDVEYGLNLEEDNDWIKTFSRPAGPVLHPKQMNTGRFYVYTQEPETIYVRMDDDIVYIEKNAIARLAEHRLDNKYPFVVFPIIWNNAVCSHYLQQMEAMPSWWGKVGNHCMDPVGWADADFAVNIHHHLLNMIAMDRVEDLFLHHSIQLPLAQQFSVSSFAQIGSEYKAVDGILGGEEEGWHTITMPWETKRANMIVPNSFISHFSFYHQRNHLLKNTDILDQYRDISQSL